MSRQQNTGYKPAPADRKPPDIRGPGKTPVRLLINGQSYNLEIEPRQTLLDVLRENLNLTGTKKGCDMGECGACTVVMDGRPVYSCLILAVECEGHEILTIEGLASGAGLDPVQKAFIDEDAFQCGFCTPGQIMSAYALLKNNPHPDEAEIRLAMSGNICRCGAYARILAAVNAAASKAKVTHGETG